MEISLKAWIEYINSLRRINDKSAELVRKYLEKNSIPQTSEEIDALTKYAYKVSTTFGEAASAAAAQMYDAVAAASKVIVPAAVPAATPTYGEVAKTINGMLKQNQGSDAIGSSIGRLVKRTGVDTTMQNAIRDGAEWAWIPQGDTCSFCIMLASNGWQKASKAALKGGHAEHIHANCDCTYAVRFNGQPSYEGYDPDKYRETYDNAEGDTWQEKLNSMRRDEYAKNADKINAQKRDIYNNPKNKMLRLAKDGNTYISKMEPLRDYAKKIKPLEGFEDIIIHGDEFSVVFRDADGKESNVSAVEFADILEKAGFYKGGKIRLIACKTGYGDGIVPTYLARRFNTEVLAPTEVVNVDWDGNIILANNELDAKMGIETGRWVLFGPNGRIE